MEKGLFHIQTLLISSIHHKINDQIVTPFVIIFFLFSAKREAVLHSAHSEDTLGAEEKARDVLCAALVLHDRPKSCSYSYCRSKSARGAVRNHNKYITIIKM